MPQTDCVTVALLVGTPVDVVGHVFANGAGRIVEVRVDRVSYGQPSLLGNAPPVPRPTASKRATAGVPACLAICVQCHCVQCVRPGFALQHSHRYSVEVNTLAGPVMTVSIAEKNLLPRRAPQDIAPPVQSAASTAGPLRTAGDSSAQPPPPSSGTAEQLLQPTSEQSSSASSASTSVRQSCAFCQHCLPCLALPCPALPCPRAARPAAEAACLRPGLPAPPSGK